MVMKSHQSHAELLLKEYLLADPLIPYTSIIGGIFACKMVYDLTNLFSALYFKSYSNLTKLQRLEWNNRAISTFHAVFITTISLYFVFCSDLFSDHHHSGPITFQYSSLSTFVLGVVHHFLSMIGVEYSMLTGEGQIYSYMVLISETTTPGINLRWYLDTAGMKRSKAYLLNGIVIFFAWLVARIVLFIYLFYQVFLHYNEVKQMHSFGVLLAVAVPVILSLMNLMWFWKIFKGLKKTLAKSTEITKLSQTRK